MGGRWIGFFPLICVVLMVIALFLPIMYIVFEIPAIPLTIEGNLIPIGGGLIEEMDPYIALDPSIENLQNSFFILGIIFAVFFGLDALLTFINAIRVMTGSKELEKARKKWLSGGILKILSQIVLILVLTYFITDYLADAGVNFTFIIGWGMILTMTTGGILIFAWILAKIAD